MLRTLITSLISLLAFAAIFISPSASPAAQFLNISTRGFVGVENHAVIGGFILRGSVAKRVLLRGIGPSLTGAGLSDVLSDPLLELRDQDGALIYSNNDWVDTQQTEIEATGLAPKDNHESAIVSDLLAPGTYTVVLRGIENGTGIGLIEVYDLSPNSGSLLANISTRGFVEPGDRTLIAGVIVGGGGTLANFIARGVGPSLSSVGITDSLTDPTLEFRASDGRLLYGNDDWKDTQQSLIEQSGFAPSRGSESALIADLGSGHFSFVLRGNDSNGGPNGSGTGVVELYHLNAPSNPVASFSFENSFEGWTPKATDIDHPDLTWSIEPSQDRATDGNRSLRFALENVNDAGKIWIERPFAVHSNNSYHVTVQFSFGTQDWGEANLWNIIAGVRTSPAVTRNDLTYQGDTGGGSRETGYVWLEKTYDFDLVSGPDGTLYVDIGVWGNWETFRAYYVDNVRITISEN